MTYWLHVIILSTIQLHHSKVPYRGSEILAYLKKPVKLNSVKYNHR